MHLFIRLLWVHFNMGRNGEFTFVKYNKLICFSLLDRFKYGTNSKFHLLKYK